MKEKMVEVSLIGNQKYSKISGYLIYEDKDHIKLRLNPDNYKVSGKKVSGMIPIMRDTIKIIKVVKNK